METERRRVARFKIRQLVEITFGRELLVRARGFDISELGLRCTTDVYLEPSTVVSLEIALSEGDDSRTIRCDGIVVWCQEGEAEFTTGISFGALKPEEREALSLHRSAEDEAAADSSEEGVPPAP